MKRSLEMKRAAPLAERDPESSSKANRHDDNKATSGYAMTHQARSDLHARAARILAESIFSHRLTNPDVHVLEEALRLVFEREAAYHARQASKLRHGGHPLEFLEVFGAAA